MDFEAMDFEVVVFEVVDEEAQPGRLSCRCRTYGIHRRLG
jgi:hypothetical protein